MRGFFEIGITHGKTEHNLGTLWRSAYQLGANGIFTVASRFNVRVAADTYKSWRHVPLRQFDDIDILIDALPYSTQLVGVEMGGAPLKTFEHPERAVYLLGAEDNGISRRELDRCHRVISLAAIRQPSFNVAVAGSIVMYDRMTKEAKS